MNKKKLLMFGLIFPLLVIGSVFAIASYYGFFSATFNTTPSITIEGINTFTVPEETIGGETIIGSEITLTNNAPSERIISIIDDSGEDVEVSYVGELELTKKTVDFNLDVWEVLNDKVQIEYTVIGEEFNAEVIGTEITGYVLVYYADNDDRFANPGQAVLVKDVLENLPGVADKNANLNDYSLEYPTTPFGAKIWYVPSNALTLNGGAYDIAWGRASEFYFESSLIQYNAEGQITIYPSEVLDFTPEYTPSNYLDDEVTVNTEIN